MQLVAVFLLRLRISSAAALTNFPAALAAQAVIDEGMDDVVVAVVTLDEIDFPDDLSRFIFNPNPYCHCTVIPCENTPFARDDEKVPLPVHGNFDNLPLRTERLRRKAAIYSSTGRFGFS